jgi:hypothetical protein
MMRSMIMMRRVMRRSGDSARHPSWRWHRGDGDVPPCCLRNTG